MTHEEIVNTLPEPYRTQWLNEENRWEPIDASTRYMNSTINSIVFSAYKEGERYWQNIKDICSNHESRFRGNNILI